MPEAGGRARRCPEERLTAGRRRRGARALRSGVGGCASAGSAASNQRAGCARGGQGRRAGHVVGSHLTVGAAVGPQPVPGAAGPGGAGGGGKRRGGDGAALRLAGRPAEEWWQALR